MARAEPFASEQDLYAPVKRFLEAQGYVVKGEVGGCDLLAVRGAEPPVIVELKLRFSLALVLQGIDRLAVCDSVYLAVPDGAGGRRAIGPEHRGVRKLCRRLGLGLIAVRRRSVDVLLDPAPYQPRKNRRRAATLLAEHARRIGDPNRGGASTRLPIMTAYRQEALRCAACLRETGPARIAALRAAADAPNAARILRRNVYGWFERVARGVYGLAPAGLADLARFADAEQPAKVRSAA
jgi:hypothetical protein